MGRRPTDRASWERLTALVRPDVRRWIVEMAEGRSLGDVINELVDQAQKATIADLGPVSKPGGEK